VTGQGGVINQIDFISALCDKFFSFTDIMPEAYGAQFCLKRIGKLLSPGNQFIANALQLTIALFNKDPDAVVPVYRDCFRAFSIVIAS